MEWRGTRSWNREQDGGDEHVIDDEHHSVSNEDVGRNDSGSVDRSDDHRVGSRCMDLGGDL